MKVGGGRGTGGVDGLIEAGFRHFIVEFGPVSMNVIQLNFAQAHFKGSSDFIRGAVRV